MKTFPMIFCAVLIMTVTGCGLWGGEESATTPATGTAVTYVTKAESDIRDEEIGLKFASIEKKMSDGFSDVKNLITDPQTGLQARLTTQEQRVAELVQQNTFAGPPATSPTGQYYDDALARVKVAQAEAKAAQEFELKLRAQAGVPAEVKIDPEQWKEVTDLKKRVKNIEGTLKASTTTVRPQAMETPAGRPACEGVYSRPQQYPSWYHGWYRHHTDSTVYGKHYAF